MSTLILIVGFSVDFIIALMAGTTFYFMWGWLIVPTFEVAALSWIGAVMVVYIIAFVTGKVTDAFDVDENDIWPYMGRLFVNQAVRCLSYAILGFGLSLMI